VVHFCAAFCTRDYSEKAEEHHLRDTLYEIAQKYKVNHIDIMRWNQIKNHRLIKPGDRIIIITPE